MNLVYDYKIIMEALENNLLDYNSIGYTNIDDVFTIDMDFGLFHMYEVSNYIFNVDDIFYNSDTGNEEESRTVITKETLGNCITELNRMNEEYRAQLEIEGDI